MKKFLITLSIFLVATAGYTQTFTVDQVIDSDTVKLTTGEEVQLIGIQAPENDKMSQKATEFVKGLGLEGKEVRLEFDVEKKDKNGRLLAYVYFRSECSANMNVASIVHGGMVLHVAAHYEDIFINKVMVKAGYATPMTVPPNVKYDDLFKELYQEAREAKRGLWTESTDDVTSHTSEELRSKLNEGMVQKDVLGVIGKPEEYECGIGGLRPTIPEHPNNECWIYAVKDGYVQVYFSGDNKKYVTWSYSNAKYPMD